VTVEIGCIGLLATSNRLLMGLALKTDQQHPNSCASLESSIEDGQEISDGPGEGDTDQSNVGRGRDFRVETNVPLRQEPLSRHVARFAGGHADERRPHAVDLVATGERRGRHHGEHRERGRCEDPRVDDAEYAERGNDHSNPDDDVQVKIATVPQIALE